MDIIDEIASEFHENWRKTRLTDAGIYEPRWKSVKDEAYVEKLQQSKTKLPYFIRKTELGYEIDIANCSYKNLSADWQNENKNAAIVVLSIIFQESNGVEFNSDQIGEIIHSAWLIRNSYAKGSDLDVPFENLPAKEKLKDLIQYKIGRIVNNAAIVRDHFSSLDEVIKYLEENKGKNIKIEFNGQTLYSEIDTADTCYLKVCGETKSSFIKKRDEEMLIWQKKRNSIPVYIKRGEALIYPERLESWKDRVIDNAMDLDSKDILAVALKIMESLNEGQSIQKAKTILESEGLNDDEYVKQIIGTVTFYSKRGVEFFKAVNENFDESTNSFLNTLIEENETFIQNEIERQNASGCAE